MVKMTNLSGRIVGVLVLSLVLGVLAAELSRTQDNLLNNDFFTFWLAGRMVWTGEQPYLTEHWVGAHLLYGATWISNPIYPYPLPLALVFVPLGLLPLSTAAPVWIFASGMMIIVSAALVLRSTPLPQTVAYLLPVGASLMLWRGTIVTLLNGQLGAWLLLIATTVLILWQHRRWRTGAILLALLVLKPTLGLPIVGLCGWWLVVRRKWEATLALVAGVIALMIVGWLFDPDWVRNMLSIGNQKLNMTFGYAPTLWGLSAVVCNHEVGCTWSVGGGLSLAVIVVALKLVSRLQSDQALLELFGGAVVVALVITPYLWAYDHVLLVLPLLVLAGLLYQKGMTYILTAALVPLFTLFSWLLLLVAYATGSDAWSAALPIVLGVMLYLTSTRCLNQWGQPMQSPERA